MDTRQQALLYLTHLLVYSDGEFDEREQHAVSYICKQERIADNDYQEFLISTQESSEREIFEKGITLLEECDDKAKTDVFVWLYKLSEADGTVHAKEVRFLLYSLRRASINFDAVKEVANRLPQIPTA